MLSLGERLIRGLGIAAVAGFLAAALTPVSNAIGVRIAVTSASPAPADAIVVLGAGRRSRELLSDESLLRTIHGIELYKQGLAPIIVFSGPGDLDGGPVTESNLRAKIAGSMGIPPGAILTEEKAQTTREESVNIAATLQRRQALRILLVTDSLHMRRAMSVFVRSGLQVQPSPSADYPAVLMSAKDRLWLSMRIVQESVALIYYRFAGFI